MTVCVAGSLVAAIGVCVRQAGSEGVAATFPFSHGFEVSALEETDEPVELVAGSPRWTSARPQGSVALSVGMIAACLTSEADGPSSSLAATEVGVCRVPVSA
ncbi:hypothetical protein [Dactylosporangium sp. NPDC051484]|uniref:hypothetical protein n=1 Tax=Dactylosporangium sp. NPDC051484 TaxID=3154942 RepID=UPI00344CA5D9